MKNRGLVPLTLCLLGGSASAWAFDDTHFDAIKRLGQLNGVALHCKALDQTQRMKRELVLNLPKRRQLGELFDNETNASFMKFIQDGASCPTNDALRAQVDEAVENLKQVFTQQ